MKYKVRVEESEEGFAVSVPGLPVQLEVKPQSHGIGNGNRVGSVDILVAPAHPEHGAVHVGQTPRVWIELKYRTHWSWDELEADLTKWDGLPWTEQDEVLAIALVSWRHDARKVVSVDDASVLDYLKAIKPLATQPVILKSPHVGWNVDGKREATRYEAVTHRLHIYRAWPNPATVATVQTRG